MGLPCWAAPCRTALSARISGLGSLSAEAIRACRRRGHHSPCISVISRRRGSPRQSRALSITVQLKDPELVPDPIELQSARRYNDYSHFTIVTSMTVSKSRFKAQALELFRQVERTGKPITIRHRGKPALQLVPYRADPEATIKVLRDT